MIHFKRGGIVAMQQTFAKPLRFQQRWSNWDSMQKLFLILISVGCLFGAPLSSLAGSDVAIIGTVLDDFHEAAAKADGQRYFAHLADNAIFMGTDATERWTVEQFKAYAMPHFSKGEGWTYKSVQRHVEIAPGGKVAWVDELLENKKIRHLPRQRCISESR